MKNLIIIIVLLICCISCGVEIVPEREFITKEECLKEEIEKRGPWDKEVVLEYNKDGTEDRIKIIWNINETKIDDSDEYTLTEYYYILWNNNDVYYDTYPYGWNISEGPVKGN